MRKENRVLQFQQPGIDFGLFLVHVETRAPDDPFSQSLGKLFLLPAGTLPPNPAELLGSRAMWRTLEELRAAFDYVVIDSPPLLAVTDAAVLSRLTTGAILIAAAGSSRRPQLESSAKSLAAADAKLLGVVLTKLPTRGPDSYGYGQYTYGAVHTTQA